jgi:hypothetical protein
MRIFSNTLFCLALGCTLFMKAFAIQDEIVTMAVFSVALAFILTNLMWIRSMGLAGVGGLSIVYANLSGRSIPGTVLTMMVTALTVTAVILAIFADIANSSKGKETTDEI